MYVLATGFAFMMLSSIAMSQDIDGGKMFLAKSNSKSDEITCAFVFAANSTALSVELFKNEERFTTANYGNLAWAIMLWRSGEKLESKFKARVNSYVLSKQILAKDSDYFGAFPRGNLDKGDIVSTLLCSLATKNDQNTEALKKSVVSFALKCQQQVGGEHRFVFTPKEDTSMKTADQYLYTSLAGVLLIDLFGDKAAVESISPMKAKLIADIRSQMASDSISFHEFFMISECVSNGSLVVPENMLVNLKSMFLNKQNKDAYWQGNTWHDVDPLIATSLAILSFENLKE